MKRFEVRLSEKMFDLLEKLAKKHETTKQNAVLLALNELDRKDSAVALLQKIEQSLSTLRGEDIKEIRTLLIEILAKQQK